MTSSVPELPSFQMMTMYIRTVNRQSTGRGKEQQSPAKEDSRGVMDLQELINNQQ